MKPFKYVALIYLVLIPFMTKPSWCVNLYEKGSEDYQTCGFNMTLPATTGELFSENEFDEHFKHIGVPSSRIPKLEPNT